MICIHREVPQLPLSSLVRAPGIAQICKAANVRRDLHTPNLFDELCAQARIDGTETFFVYPGMAKVGANPDLYRNTGR